MSDVKLEVTIYAGYRGVVIESVILCKYRLAFSPLPLIQLNQDHKIVNP